MTALDKALEHIEKKAWAKAKRLDFVGGSN
jgi:hypothetical protein